MKIEFLRFNHFRNIDQIEFTPNPQLNFFIGKNAQGKTSVLEAIGFLSNLNSFRNSKPAELIQWGKLKSEIDCNLVQKDIHNGDWKTHFHLQLLAEQPDRHRVSKIISVNNKIFRSTTHYFSQKVSDSGLGFHAIVFNPADHELIRGEPRLRRVFLNQTLSAEDADYLMALKNFSKVLEQRNAHLKSVDSGFSQILHEELSQQMVYYGSLVAFKRLEWFGRFVDIFKPTLQRIAPAQPLLETVYLSSWIVPKHASRNAQNSLEGVHFTGQVPLPSLEEIERSYKQNIKMMRDAELRARTSLVGPHRDDWTFVLRGQTLKGQGSQGEVRSALLALKLSEIEEFRSKTGRKPVLLLDDFSSELDWERRQFLLDYLIESDLQVFVTTTEDQLIEGKKFFVINGHLEQTYSESETFHDLKESPTKYGNQSESSFN